MTQRSPLIVLFLLVFVFFAPRLFAQKGKDGVETVTASVIYNRFTTLGATAVAGATAIVVDNAIGLSGSATTFTGAANPYQTDALTAGDLLMILKIQGASIDQTNTSTYGNITGYNGVGDYELVEVGTVNGNTIEIANGCPLANGYTVSATERVQVIRVPRLQSLTVTSTGTITTPAWSSPSAVYTGGIVAIEVAGNLVNSGTISAKGKGFIGGQIEDSSNLHVPQANFVSADPFLGAEKGESIAGNRFDYDNMGGRYCQGAPANGGGGGNAHNAGGGGGSNGNNGSGYNGKGIPDPNPVYAAAWALEVPTLTGNITSGGGRGGYTYSNSDQNALLTAPGSTLWAGDYRKVEGGGGGKPLNTQNNTKLFFGGGGGAGDANGAPLSTQPGGSGGGIVYLLVNGNVSGNGAIDASGDNALNSVYSGSDGMGGGGGGGSAIVLAAGTVTQSAIVANGGKGGDQDLTPTPSDEQAEGPGGGGGGGYILTTTVSTSLARTVNGGLNGVSTSSSVAEFPPNGATIGTEGKVLSNGTLPLIPVRVDLSVTATGNSIPLCLGGQKTYTVVIHNPSFYAATSVTVNVPTPAGIVLTGSAVTVGAFASPNWTIASLAAGSSQTLTLSSTITATNVAAFNATLGSAIPECVSSNNTVTIGSSTVIAVNLVTSATPSVICFGQTSSLNVTGATSYSWNPGALAGAAITVTPATTATYTVIGAIGSCTNTAVRSITVNPLPTLTISPGTPAICYGNTLTLNASGASTYIWNGGPATGATLNISPTVTTVYSVTAESAAGCSNTATREVTVNPLPTPAISPASPVICAGAGITLTGSGAASYTWNPGVANSTVSVSPATTTVYMLTGKSTAGCTNTVSVTVTVNPLPTLNISPASPVICFGSNVTLSGSGASSYTWMPGSIYTATLTASPAATTAYTLTGQDAAGCINTVVKSVTVNSLPTLTVSPPTFTICYGQSATLTAAGAVAYTWNPGSGTSSSMAVTPAASTIYTVTGLSGVGCRNTQTVSLTVNTTPTVSAGTSTAAICLGGSATLTASGAGTYTWNPGALTGATVAVNPASNTVYTVTGSNGFGCHDAAMASLTVNANPSVTATASSMVICAGGTSNLTASGALSYTWQPGSLTGATVTISPGASATYTLTGTNAAGCINTQTTAVTVNANPTISAIASSTAICAGATGSLTAMGAATYTWNPGNLTGSLVTVSPASTTIYTVAGTNSSGCTSTQTLALTVNANPTVNASANLNAICVGATASLTATGASGYTWNPGALTGSIITVTPVATTVYTITGTDGNGCSNTRTLGLTVNANPTVTALASASAICQGLSATLTPGGAISYTWYPGVVNINTFIVSPVASTIYSVTGTNAAGCVNTQTVIIAVNANPTISAVAGSTAICVGATGSLTAMGAATYTWNPGNLTGSLVTVSPASTTIYTVAGTNSSGCTSTQTLALTVNANPTVNASANLNAICVGATASLTATGASGYTWNPGALTGSIVAVTPVATTVYTLTGTDGNGCSNTRILGLTVNANPTVTALASASAICQGLSATLTPGGAISYTWYPGAVNINSFIVSPVVTTIYSVTGINAAGCVNTQTVTMAVNANPTITASSNPTLVCSGASSTLTASGALSYTWLPAASTTSTLVVNPATTSIYTVTGANGFGCVHTKTLSVAVNASPVINISGNASAICSGEIAMLTAGGANTFTWQPGTIFGNSISVAPPVSSIYTVSGTNSFGCVSSQTAALLVNANPTLLAVASPSMICKGASSTLNVSGAIIYLWTPVNISNASVVVTPSVTTVYTVTGKNSSGCTTTETLSLIVNANPVVNAGPTAATVCTGDSIILIAGGAVSYTWSPGLLTGGSVTVRPTTATVYTITGTNPFGCTGTGLLQVNVNPLPLVNATASKTVICLGQVVTLSASGASVYSWNPGNINKTTFTVSPGVTTVYTVTGTSAAGCRSVPGTIVVIVSGECRNPVIGLAKAASMGPRLPDGSYDITYTITVKNLGNEVLKNIEVKDNLDAAIPAPGKYFIQAGPITTGALKANPAFNGSSDVNLLKAASSQLGVDSIETIVMTINVSPASLKQIKNIATAAAVSLSGGATSDTSEPGDAPDSDGNGIANEAIDNKPTVTDIPFDGEIHIPEGFSPNNDGTNDVFVIRGIDKYPNSNLKILNRWGNIIYNKNSYDNSWSGKNAEGTGLNGEDLPEGTYFYLLDLGTGEKPYKGYIYLNRAAN